MRYIPNTEEQKKEMLKEIGVSSFEELIKAIPQSIRLKERLNIPEAISESELEDKIHHIAQKNSNFFLMKPFGRCRRLQTLHSGSRKISLTKRGILDLLHPIST